MVSKELLEKAKKCSTKEELLELAKQENVEVSDDEISAILSSFETNKELSDEELENVTGGSCYSGETYDSLGVPYASDYQVGSNHPLITTIRNYCWMSGNRYCQDCLMMKTIGAVNYCGYRSQENDPA